MLRSEDYPDQDFQQYHQFVDTLYVDIRYVDKKQKIKVLSNPCVTNSVYFPICLELLDSTLMVCQVPRNTPWPVQCPEPATRRLDIYLFSPWIIRQNPLKSSLQKLDIGLT